MKKRQEMAAILAAAMTMTLLAGCGNDTPPQSQGTEQSESSRESQGTSGTDAGTAGDDVPTIVIYNNSGAFSVSGAEAGSDESAYKEMQDYILEQTGVKVEVIMPPSDASADRKSVV